MKDQGTTEAVMNIIINNPMIAVALGAFLLCGFALYVILQLVNRLPP